MKSTTSPLDRATLSRRAFGGLCLATVAKCKFDLEVCGGIYVNEPCVVDGNLVSGRTYHDNGPYFGAFMKLLRARRDGTAAS